MEAESDSSSAVPHAKLSGSFAPRRRLWLDRDGSAKIRYTVGKTTNLNTEAAFGTVVGAVLQTTNLWTSKTDGCIQFVKLSPDVCSKKESLDHGVVHIDTFEAKCCSAYFGNIYGQENGTKKCQELCIDRRDCTRIEMRNLVTHTLGLLSPMNRPDRDDYIAFHPELLSEKLWPPLTFNAKPRWLSLQRCSSSLVSMNLPVPYDYLSALHPVTSQYSESSGDPQGVVVTKHGAKQYLLDHRRAACPLLSHLDLYQVHKLYGCEKKFAHDCQSTPPKCLNYGYLKKNCTCACSKHFTGPRCEKKIYEGPDFCFGNAWFLSVNTSGLYNTTDLGMRLEADTAPLPSNGDVLLRFMQFLTVSIQLAEIGKLASVAVRHITLETVITRLQSRLGFFIDNINMTDCDLYSGGSVLYWGAILSNHIRSWCFSSLFLNEPFPIILRSRVPKTLNLAFRSSIGFVTEDAQLSIDILQLQLEVSSFGVMNTSQPDWKEEEAAGGSRSAGGGTKSSVAEALTSAGAGGVVGAVLVGVLLLAVIGAVAAWMWSRAEDEDDSEGSEVSSEETEENVPVERQEAGRSSDGNRAAVREREE